MQLLQQTTAVIAIIASLTSVVDSVPEFTEPQLIRCTCYTATGHKMADGTEPYEGAIAGKKEDIGKYVILYTKDMEYIGVFQIRDTGGKYIRTGQRIDVYRDTLKGCYEWVDTYGDYVYYQIEERNE